MDLLKIVEESHEFDWVRAYETLGEHSVLRGVIILVFVVASLLALWYFFKDYKHYLTIVGYTKVSFLKSLNFCLFVKLLYSLL